MRGRGKGRGEGKEEGERWTNLCETSVLFVAIEFVVVRGGAGEGRDVLITPGCALGLLLVIYPMIISCCCWSGSESVVPGIKQGQPYLCKASSLPYLSL